MFRPVAHRVAVTVLLALEATLIALWVVVLSVPLDRTFAAFDDRPISRSQAYLNAAPEIVLLAILVVAIASLWLRGGRAGRPGLLVASAAHAAIGLWFLTGVGGRDSSGLLFASALFLGWAALIAWEGRPRRSVDDGSSPAAS